MKKNIKITIPEPCHQDWAKMTLTQKGKHCAVCEKEVVDFTKATDEQLYKTATNGGNLCGRFTKGQLDRSIYLERKEGRSWANYAATLLIPAAMLATQEIMAQDTIQPTEQTDGNYTSLGISSLSRKQTKNDTIQKSDTYTIKGMISDENGPIPFANAHIKGTESFIQTSLDGMYTLKVTKGDIILFSSLGYHDLEIKVKEQKILNVTLKDYPLIMMGELRVIKSDNTSH